MNLANLIATCLSYLFGIVGIILNLLLFWIIKTKTPKIFSNFKWLLLNIVIADGVEAFAWSFMEGRIVFIDKSIVIIVYGK